MARWRPWVVISAVTWQRYCANKNGSEKPVSNCWRRVDLPGRVVHRASQGGWSKRLSLMHMGARPPPLTKGGRAGGKGAHTEARNPATPQPHHGGSFGSLASPLSYPDPEA